MANRFRDSGIWDQEWYMILPCRLKNLTDFVRDRCDISGVWSPNFTIANAYINPEKVVTEAELLAIDDGKQFEKLPNGKIFCVDFIPFQYSKLSLESRVHVKVIELAKRNGIFDRINHLIVDRSETIQAKRARISEKLKKQIFAEDEYNCQYCGSHFSYAELVIDHIIPLGKGGDNENENLTTSCISCNAKKWELDVFEFIERHSITPLNSLSKKLNTLSKKLDSLEDKDKDKEEDKEQDLDKDQVKDSSEATVIKIDLPVKTLVATSTDDQFAEYEYWAEQISTGKDQFFQQMMIVENIRGQIDIPAFTKSFLALLAQYPKKAPPTQHRFRVALIGHITENLGKAKSNDKTLTDKRAKAREI